MVCCYSLKYMVYSLELYSFAVHVTWRLKTVAMGPKAMEVAAKSQ